MTEPIDVVIVDDHRYFRRGLRAVLDEPGQPSIRVVGEAKTVAQGLELVEDLLPDVLIADLEFEKKFTPGLELIREAIRISPTTQVVVMTAHEEDEYLAPALLAGANGCIAKGDDLPGSEIRAAIMRISHGERYFGPAVAQQLLGMRPTLLPAAALVLDDLTPREREVIVQIAAKRSDQEIADALGLGIRTIKHHVSNILQKLQLQCRHEAAFVVRSQPESPA